MQIAMSFNDVAIVYVTEFTFGIRAKMMQLT